MQNTNGDDYNEYYADVVAASSLDHVLNQAFAQIKSPLEAKGGLGASYSRIERAERFSQIYMALNERLFLPDFWLRGVCMGHLKTPSVDELALVLHCWNFEDCRVAEMVARFPQFSLARANAAAFEEGTEIESEWKRYSEINAGTALAPIIELASRHERLGQLFPYMSVGRLGFSRTTGFPYTFDLPLVHPHKGVFLVVDYDGKILTRTESPEEAIAQVASLLPPYCKRAISGTCEDLPETDPYRRRI